MVEDKDRKVNEFSKEIAQDEVEIRNWESQSSLLLSFESGVYGSEIRYLQFLMC